jgi:putative flippase GtrA
LLGVADGLLHWTSVPAALISQIGGALVSYVLSRWAWERKGKPDLLRETIPFWIVFAVATAISTGATKLAYTLARLAHLHDFRQVLFVEAIYLLANIATFLMRFVIFHYVLFADRTPDAKNAGSKNAGSKNTGPMDASPTDGNTGTDIPAASAHSGRHAQAQEPPAADDTAMASSAS